jgi:hypothetical protein
MFDKLPGERMLVFVQREATAESAKNLQFDVVLR